MPAPRRSVRAVGVALGVALGVAGLLAVTGCTGEDAAPAVTDPVPQTVRADLAELWAGDAPSRQDAEAGRCFADALAERTTLTDLRDAGLVDGSDAVVADLPVLDESVARDWVAAQLTCVDFVEESTRAQVAATKGALDAPAYAACLGEALDDEAVAAALVATLSGGFDSPAVERLSRAQVDCAAGAAPPAG